MQWWHIREWQINFRLFRWRRANNATGTSSNHSGNHSSTNGDNVTTSSDDEDDDELAQRPLQMYLHHQQYYKQMKEIQKQQKESATVTSIDKSEEDDVDVNWLFFILEFMLCKLHNRINIYFYKWKTFKLLRFDAIDLVCCCGFYQVGVYSNFQNIDWINTTQQTTSVREWERKNCRKAGELKRKVKKKLFE